MTLNQICVLLMGLRCNEKPEMFITTCWTVPDQNIQRWSGCASFSPQTSVCNSPSPNRQKPSLTKSRVIFTTDVLIKHNMKTWRTKSLFFCFCIILTLPSTLKFDSTIPLKDRTKTIKSKMQMNISNIN